MHTQENPIDPSLGGVLSGVPHHIMDQVRLAQLTYALVEFCQVARCRFLWTPSVCGVLHCPAGPQAEQRIAKFSALSIQLRMSQPACKPTFEGVELSDLEVARQSNPYGAGL